MIRYYAKAEGKLVELDSLQSGCWVHIEPPFTHEELEAFASKLEFPIDFLTDSLDIDERARYDRDEQVKHIILNTPILSESEPENDAVFITVPIGIILVPEHVVTISAFENPVLDAFLEGKVKNFNPKDDKQFVLQMLEQNVYRFLSCLKKLNIKRNLIEKELLDSSRNQELVQLLKIEKSLVYFVNSLSANELLIMKMKRTDFLGISKDEDLSDWFEDIMIDTHQALEMANVYTNIHNSVMETYGNIISNNVNQVMKRLTLITIILMVPTLIYSFFGMNVPLFGFEQRQIATYFILVLSIVFSVLIGLYFQRKKYF